MIVKNKKIIAPIIALIVILIITGIVYFIFTKEDKDTTLNLIEKQWIETNKNNVIFMSIVSDVPSLSYDGEGIIIDFLDALNNDTNLSFNKASYKIGTDPTTDYAFKMVDSVGDNDILIYRDNYAIVTKDGKSYKSLSDLSGLTIGVLNDNLDSINYYLNGANVTYKTYDSADAMLANYNSDNSDLSAVILLKTCDLKKIIENNYTISYNITDYTKSIVLSLGNQEKIK